jgi:hypothetical protein
MTRKTLEIFSSDRVEMLAKLVWEDGTLSAFDVAPDFAPAVERWLAGGLQEWHGPFENAQPRLTFPSDSAFLDRLEAYLRRQFAFITSAKTEIIQIEVVVVALTVVPSTSGAQVASFVSSPVARSGSSSHRQIVSLSRHRPFSAVASKGHSNETAFWERLPHAP